MMVFNVPLTTRSWWWYLIWRIELVNRCSLTAPRPLLFVFHIGIFIKSWSDCHIVKLCSHFSPVFYRLINTSKIFFFFFFFFTFQNTLCNANISKLLTFSISEKQYLSDGIFTFSSITPVRKGWVKIVNTNAEPLIPLHSSPNHSLVSDVRVWVWVKGQNTAVKVVANIHVSLQFCGNAALKRRITNTERAREKYILCLFSHTHTHTKLILGLIVKFYEPFSQ